MGNIDILDTLERLALPCVRVDELLSWARFCLFGKKRKKKKGKRKSYEVEPLSVFAMNE